jgi:uncharacterized membrane protein
MVSNHSAMTYGGRHNWLTLIALSFAGACIRFWFVARHKPQGRRGWRAALPAGLAVVTILALVAALAPASPTGQGALAAASAPGSTHADAALVHAIVAQRCVPCHAARPTQAGFNAPPNGVVLESLNELRAHLPEVQKQLALHTMPLGNLTHMTDEERATVLMWIGHGAAN